MLPVSDHLHLEQDGGWLTVWFTEPGRRNPLTGERIEALMALCDALRDSDLRGVIFRGRGGVFCAGGDLNAFRSVFRGDAGRDDIKRLSLRAGDLFDSISALPQFTVMAVEGAAMAGGFGLVCCGDYVLAEDTARFALSEVRIGLVPAQIAPFVVARLGPRAGRRLMLTGEMVSGAAAREVGLADRLVPAGGMEAALAELRGQLRDAAPEALAAIKRQVADLPRQSREEQRQAAAVMFAEAVLSGEAREGIAAFFDKRKPNWAEK